MLISICLQKDINQPGNWTICKSIEEAMEVSVIFINISIKINKYLIQKVEKRERDKQKQIDSSEDDQQNSQIVILKMFY